MKQYRLTLLALALCFLLFLYIHFFERTNPSAEITLYTISTPGISALEIHDQGKILRLEKNEKGEWQVGEDKKAGDATKISPLLDFWSHPKGTRVELNGAPDWEKYGLERPEKELRIVSAAGEKRVQIGKKNPLAWKYFARLPDDNSLHLITDFEVTRLVTEPGQFVSTPPPPPSEAAKGPSNPETDAH